MRDNVVMVMDLVYPVQKIASSDIKRPFFELDMVNNKENKMTFNITEVMEKKGSVSDLEKVEGGRKLRLNFKPEGYSKFESRQEEIKFTEPKVSYSYYWTDNLGGFSFDMEILGMKSKQEIGKGEFIYPLENTTVYCSLGLNNLTTFMTSFKFEVG